MAVVPPLDDEDFDPDLLEFVQFFKGPLGVIPNSVRTMARRPEVALAFTNLNIAVMKCEAGVTPEFKRLIGYMTSYTSGCRYCQAHTILGSERFGSSEERLNDVWDFDNSSNFSDAEKAALKFARAAAMVPNEVDDALAEELRQHWDHGEIVEIMAVIALFGFLNRWNDSMGSALEELPIQAGEQHLGQTGWDVGKHR